MYWVNVREIIGVRMKNGFWEEIANGHQDFSGENEDHFEHLGWYHYDTACRYRGNLTKALCVCDMYCTGGIYCICRHITHTYFPTKIDQNTECVLYAS